MQNTVHKSKSRGFTIIEVLIVLAIAGLIMVVVFLAVPALQRNSRNTALSTDANNILSGVGTYVANNNGTLPANQASAAVAGGSITIGATGTNQETVKVGAGTANFSVATAQSISATSAIGTVQVITGTAAKCNAGGTGLSGTASGRSYVVLYVAETAGSNIVKCIGN